MTRTRLVFGCLIAVVSAAATAQEHPLRIQRLQIGAEQLGRILRTEKLVPVDKAELDRRLKALAEAEKAPGPAAALLVRYDAVLTAPDKLQGTLTATLPASARSARRLLSLGHPQLTELQLPNEIPWGADASGRTLALLPESAEFLSGRWTQLGTKRPWGVEFRLAGLEAAARRIVLRLSNEYRVESTAAVTSRPQPGSMTEWTLISSATEPTTVTLIRSARSPRQSPLVDSRITWSVRPESTGFRAEYSLRSDAPVTGFSVSLPQNATVEQVSYGDGIRLPIDLVRTESDRRLQISLPRPLIGPGRTLVLSGRTPSIADREWLVPELAIQHCTTVEGTIVPAVTWASTVRIFIGAPLELQTLLLDGFRQTDSVFDVDGSQTISLARIAADADARLMVGQPERKRRYRTINLVTASAPLWTTRTVIMADAPLPTRLQAILSAGLEVVDVSAGKEQVPCEYSISQRRDGSQEVLLTLPPTETDSLEIRTACSGPLILPVCRVSEQHDSETILHVLPDDVLAAAGLSPPSPPLSLAAVVSDIALARSLQPPDHTVLELSDGRPIRVQPPPVDSVEPAPAATDSQVPAPRSEVGSVSLQLTSRFHPAPARDQHLAHFRAPGGDHFSIRLSPEARISSVQVDGIATRFRRDADMVAIPLDGSVRTNVIEIRYESPAPASGLLTSGHDIPVPQSGRITELTWTIDAPAEMTVIHTRPFGPRQPESWLSVFGHDDIPGATRRQLTAALPYVPTALHATVAHQSVCAIAAWLAFSTAVLGGVLLALRDRRRTLAAIAILTGIAVGIGPQPWTGVFMGILLGLTLPVLFSDLLGATKPAIPRPSELSATRVMTGMMLLATALTFHQLQAGQADDNYRVFELAGEEMCYADARLLELVDARIAETTAPFGLIATARYDVRINGNSCDVAARLRVLIPDASHAGAVDLPFADANPEECRVNGTPASFLRGAGSDISIEIPASEPEDGEAGYAIADVDVLLHLPFSTGQCRLRLPPAVDASVVLSPESPADTLINDRPVLPSRRHVLSMPHLIVSRQDRADQGHAPEPKLTSHCTIEVGPADATIVHQISVEPGSRPVPHLDLHLPPAHRFKVLKCEAACRQRVIPAPDGAWLAVDFDTPLTQDASIELQLVHTEPGLRNRTLPLAPLLPEQAPEPAVISAKPGFEMTRLHRTKPGESRDLLVPAIDGPKKLVVDDSFTLQFDLTSLTPVRHAWVTQRVRVEPQRLDYSMQAELQIVNGPVFDHVLTVDERLSIDTIAVRENRVDRLARYQRRGRRLWLLLDGRTSGVQEVVIRGSIRRTVDDPTEIPEVRVESARLQESTLTIERDPGLVLTLENKDGIPFAVQPDSAAAEDLSTQTEATFRLIEGSQLPLIRTSLKQPPRVSSVCFLQETAGEPPRRFATWVFLIERTPTSEPRVGIRLNGASIRSVDGCDLELSEDEQSAALLFADSQRAVVVVGFDMPPTQSELPEVSWIDNVERGPRLLGVSAEIPVHVPNSSDPASGLPDWAAAHQIDNFRLFTGTGPWQIEPDARSAPGDAVAREPVAVALIENQIWQSESETAGITTLIPAKATGILTIGIPPGVRVGPVEVNGRLVPGERPTDVRLDVPLSAGDSHVRLRWRAETTSVVRTPFAPSLEGPAYLVVRQLSPSSRPESAQASVKSAVDYAREVSPYLGSVHARVQDSELLLVLNDGASGPAPVLTVSRDSSRLLRLGLTATLSLLIALAFAGGHILTPRARAAGVLLVAAIVLFALQATVVATLCLLLTAVAWWALPRPSMTST